MNDLESMSGRATEKAGENEIALLKEAIDEIRSDVGEAVIARRSTNADIRYCRWDGQGDDGRKRKKNLGRDAFPFEGASDNRIRLADKVILEHVRDYKIAARRATPRVTGMEGLDEAGASRVSTLIRWLIKNQWGAKYYRELELLGNWMEGDCPAVAFLGVWWRQELALTAKRIDRNQFVADALNVLGPEATPEDTQRLADAAFMPGMEDVLQQGLMAAYPDLNEAKAKRAAGELFRDGETLVPIPYVRVNVPELEALRLYDDVWVPANTRDLETARIVFLRRWFSRAQVRERAAAEGWSDEFVAALIGDDENDGAEKKSCFPDLDQGDDAKAIDAYESATPRAGLYEVVWAYRRATDPDGRMGVMVTTFSGVTGLAAKASELLDYAHGKIPMVEFARERLTRRLLDSRPVTELVMTQQQSLKLMADSVEDHVQVFTNPPLVKGKGTPKYQVALAPFGQLEENPRENVRFLDRPAYPQAAEGHRLYVQAEVDDYFGRENQALAPERALEARQARVDGFLASLADALMMAVQLCQQYMRDEDVQRIVGGAGVQLGRSREEIQGAFDLVMVMDMRDLDQEYVLSKAKVLLENVRPLDVRSALPYEQFLTQIVAAIDPNWADMIPPMDQADARVISDEQGNYVKILAGVEPPMPEKPDNPTLRMQVLQAAHAPRQQNPGAFPEMAPATMAMLENRVKYLTQAMQQEQNAVIGRVGTKPVDVESLKSEG